MTLLVSCIMPTYNRRRFVPRAVACFLNQDYPNRELIVVDDGSDAVADLMPQDPRVTYIRLDQRLTVGAKRNLAIERAHGSLIAHWDDDDWHAPHRLQVQVAALERNSTIDACGTRWLLYVDDDHQAAWRYEYPAGQRMWLAGGTLCYRRAFWLHHPFPAVDVAEDARFVFAGQSDRMLALPDASFYVATIHADNVSRKSTTGPYWQPYPVDRVLKMIAEHAASPRDTSPSATLTPFAIAHAADLRLPEFEAFNHDQNLPWMRRWELPFALAHAQLGNTMSVFNCTINPVNMRERLVQLFRHILYRHWNPIQGGQFSLPIGQPDTAFDRVLCINTLEHLLRPQRRALIAALACKLKPGGRLVVTCDYYFDSAWTRPEFQRSALLRADRTEVFGGFNRVTPLELVEVCAEHGLQPVGTAPDPPREEDSSLYVNQPPFTHACFGAVFDKGPVSSAGRRVVLALPGREARFVESELQLLQRFGHTAHFAESDAGSLSRQRAIDYARAVAADYVLLADADVEPMPFSSVAMLRYLEDCGAELSGVVLNGRSTAGRPVYSLRQAVPEEVHDAAYLMVHRSALESAVEQATPVVDQLRSRGFVVHHAGFAA